MWFRRNLGSKEGIARIVGGMLIVACSVAAVGWTPLGLVLVGSGIATALTGVFGFCPACAAVGRRPLE